MRGKEGRGKRASPPSSWCEHHAAGRLFERNHTISIVDDAGWSGLTKEGETAGRTYVGSVSHAHAHARETIDED